jgi:hypothetical protein
MRPETRLLDLLADGRAAPVLITEVSVVPLVGAGMLTELIEIEPPPPGANYVARARGRQLLVTPEEMTALVEAGAAFDQGAG